MRRATETLRMPEAWLQNVQRQGHGYKPADALSLHDQAVECVLMGLRLREGIDMPRLQALNPGFFDESALDTLKEDGLISIQDHRLSITRQGRPVTNAILRELIA